MLAHLDGSRHRGIATAGLERLARRYASWLEIDVFMRGEEQDGELPNLPLGATYVEPSVTVGGNDPADAIKSISEQLLASGTDSLLVLRAPFGFGKSLTCRVLAARLSATWLRSDLKGRFPLFIHAPQALSGHVSTLESAIKWQLAAQTELSAEAVSWIWEHLDLTIILDSFDEVVLSQPAARGWIEEMQRVVSHPRHTVLLATRPYGIERRWFRSNDLVFDINPFDSGQVEQWLAATEGLVHHGVSAEEIVARLGPELSGTPILLLMGAWGWGATEAIQGEADRATLYEGFLERISRGKWEGVQEEHPGVVEGLRRLDAARGEGAFRRALMLLAWRHLINEQLQPGIVEDDGGADGLPLREVHSLLSAHFNRCKEAGEAPLTQEDIGVVTRSLVLSMFFRAGGGGDDIRFSHRSFREFLCAKHVVGCFLEDCGTRPNSRAYVALAQARLGKEEVAFIAGLVRRFTPSQKGRVLSLCDHCVQERRDVFLQAQDEAETGSTPDGEVVWRVAHRMRSFYLNRNGAMLAALMRGYPDHTVSLIQQAWTRQELRSGIRLLHLPGGSRLERERNWRVGYEIEGGKVVLLVHRRPWDLKQRRDTLLAFAQDGKRELDALALGDIVASVGWSYRARLDLGKPAADALLRLGHVILQERPWRKGANAPWFLIQSGAWVCARSERRANRGSHPVREWADWMREALMLRRLPVEAVEALQEDSELALAISFLHGVPLQLPGAERLLSACGRLERRVGEIRLRAEVMAPGDGASWPT